MNEVSDHGRHAHTSHVSLSLSLSLSLSHITCRAIAMGGGPVVSLSASTAYTLQSGIKVLCPLHYPPISSTSPLFDFIPLSSVHVSGPIISSHVSPSLRDLGTSGEECVTHCRNSQVFTCPPSATSFFKICRNNREINMAVSNISPFNINISNHGDW